MGKRKILDPDSFKSKKQCERVQNEKQEGEEKEKQEREEKEKQERKKREVRERKKKKKQESKVKHECLPLGLKSVDYKSLIQSENFSIIEKLTVEVQKLLKLQKDNAVDLILSAALDLNIEDLIDFKYTQYPIEETNSEKVTYYCEFYIGTTKLAISGGENRYIAKKKASENALNTLLNLPLIEKFSEEVQKLLNINNGDNIYDLLLRAAISLGIENSFHLKFATRIMHRKKFDYTYSGQFCEVFIGATKIAHALDNTKSGAKRKASYKALYVMTHMKDLPAGTLERGKTLLRKKLVSKSSTNGKWDRELLETTAFEMKRETMKRQDVLSTLYTTFARVGRLEDLVYNSYKDVSSPNGGEAFVICDALVNNVPMASGRALTKKKARLIAAKNLKKFFLDLFERKRKSSDASKDVYADVLRLIDDHSQRTPLNMERMSINETTRQAEIVKSNIVPTATFSPLVISKVKAIETAMVPVADSNKEVEDSTNSFSINERLYNNSIKQNLLLFDRSEILDEEQHSACSDLSYAVCHCHRTLGFNYRPQIDETYMVDVLLDNKIIGTGIAATKTMAKNEAVKIVLEELQKEIYTIKVKERGDEVLEIDPSDLINLKFNRKKLKTDGRRHFIWIRRKLGLLFNRYQKKEDKNIYIKRKIKVKDILDTLIKSCGKTSKHELVDMSN
ncbi:uncharacterized protein [Parasteatoda tepidariorum]|uniref:uncharacterized protein isoform X2 n=1 Tax=Parasteatoda tepidariorum TaxID=114398 RepID=UPI0039BCB459